MGFSLEATNQVAVNVEALQCVTMYNSSIPFADRVRANFKAHQTQTPAQQLKTGKHHGA